LTVFRSALVTTLAVFPLSFSLRSCSFFATSTRLWEARSVEKTKKIIKRAIFFRSSFRLLPRREPFRLRLSSRRRGGRRRRCLHSRSSPDRFQVGVGDDLGVLSLELFSPFLLLFSHIDDALGEKESREKKEGDETADFSHFSAPIGIISRSEIKSTTPSSRDGTAPPI